MKNTNKTGHLSKPGGRPPKAKAIGSSPIGCAIQLVQESQQTQALGPDTPTTGASVPVVEPTPNATGTRSENPSTSHGAKSVWLSSDGKYAFTKLRTGETVKVSAEDVAWLTLYPLTRSRSGRRGDRYYVIARVGGRRKRLHRLILRAPDGVLVDHKDNDPMNNARDNIRLANGTQNNANQYVPRNRSRLKGVWKAFGDTWGASIYRDNKETCLGIFQTKEEAARAYDNAARRLFGEFARTNKELQLV